MSVPPFFILAVPAVVLVNRQWWQGLPPHVVNTGFLILIAAASVAAYWAWVGSYRVLLKRAGLLCPECGHSLFGHDQGATVLTAGSCPACGAQVIEPDAGVPVSAVGSAPALASLGTARPTRYNPLHEWRGFLVIVAWIVSPLRVVLSDVWPKECPPGDCLGLASLWHGILMFWSLGAPGIIASAAHLAWHWYRSRTAAAR